MIMIAIIEKILNYYFKILSNETSKSGSSQHFNDQDFIKIVTLDFKMIIHDYEHEMIFDWD